MVLWPLLVTVLAPLLALLFERLAYPSPDLMRSIAEIGATLLVAWTVEAAWMATNNAREGDEREDWLGSIAGFGICGLLALVVALAVAEHRAAGHGNLLDDIGLWWSVVALVALGAVVVMHPVIVERWTAEPGD